MTNKQKMLAGEWFCTNDSELVFDRYMSQQAQLNFNNSLCMFDKHDKYLALLHAMLPNAAESVQIQHNFHCDYGYNISIGHNSFVNYNCVFLDCATINIGANVFIGPGVQLYTAVHAQKVIERNQNLMIAKPIFIGDNCWIGGNSIIMPGVSIGQNCIIGAGSIITKDISANTKVIQQKANTLQSIIS